MPKVDYSKYWTAREGETAGELLSKWVKEKPDETFIVFGERRITWKELDKLTACLASGLLDLGMKKGDRIGILGPNHPEVLISWFAAARVGIVVVPINTRYRKMELEYLINDSGCMAVVTIDEFDRFNFSDAVKEIGDKNSTLKHIIVYGNEKENDKPFLSFDNFVNEVGINQPSIEANKPKSSEELMILYTSGTTGVPKGVVHTHDSMLCNSKAYLEEVWHITTDDIVLLAMPWTHMIGHQMFFNSAFLLGQTLVLMEAYNPILLVDIMEKEKVTWFVGVPTMFMLPIMKIPDFDKHDLSSLKFGVTCGFYAPPEQMKLFKTSYDIDLIQLLGSTEAGGMLMNRRDDPEDVAFICLGRPVSNMKLKICDKDGQDVPVGDVGELWFKGPSIFKCYWNKPDVTKKEKDADGYWHSGDMGRQIDERGNVQMVSRKKDVVIRGGFNIYPGEIEAFVLNMSEVQMAVLIGYPDKVLGGKTFLNVMLKEGKVLTEAQVRSKFSEYMANYKMPDIIKIQSSPLPLLPTGKADKVAVRKTLLKEMGLDDVSL